MPEGGGWDFATSENNKQNHHYRIREPNLFVLDSLRNVKISDGISSVMGKLKSDSKGSMVMQNLLFDKDKFTPDEAKKWLSDHPDVKKFLLLPENIIEKSIFIQKIKMTKGLVGGVVLRANKTDLQGDIYGEEFVEEAAHDFMVNYRFQSLMHGDPSLLEKAVIAKAFELYIDENTGKKVIGIDIEKLIETSQIPKPFQDYRKEHGVYPIATTEKAAPGLEQKTYGHPVDSMFFSQEIIDLVKKDEILAGDWYMVSKITDPDLLKMIEDGKIKSFSIGAIADCRKVEEEDNK